MPLNNFLLFDQNKGNMMEDEAYSVNMQRLNGVQSGVASSMLNNKFAYQVSLVAYAIAQMMNANGIDATDTMAVSQFVNNLSSTVLQKIADKASVEEAKAGTSDTKWMSPMKTRNAISAAAANGVWKELTKFTVAGTYTWTAPDLLGNGQPYDIGVFLIGGGGGGGVAVKSSSYFSATGGAAGDTLSFITQVIPGQQYEIVVGSGGAAGSTSLNTFAVKGTNGGSTKFGELESKGGNGGNANQSEYAEGQSVSGAYSGSQGSDDALIVKDPSLLVPCEGTFNATIVNSSIASTRSSYPSKCFNPFFPGMIISAGGSSSFAGTFNLNEIKNQQDVKYSSQSPGMCLKRDSSYTGSLENSIIPSLTGAGGGSFIVLGTIPSGSTAKAAPGTDGGCFIYVSAMLGNTEGT